MSEVLVAMPFAAGELSRLFDPPSVIGYAPTADLKDTFDLPSEADDEADRAALVVASVAALSRWGSRRVATALVSPSQVSPGADRGHGEVHVHALAPRQMVAWFADAPGVDVRAAAAAAAGMSIDEAWEAPEVATLLSQDLLWHDVAEPDAAEPDAREPENEPRPVEPQED